MQFWYELEGCAIGALQNPGKKFHTSHEGIYYVKQGSFLRCHLPSGRFISYPYPKLEMVDTPWGTKKLGVTAKWVDSKTHKWVRRIVWYGIFMENLVQGIARDLLANSLLNLDERGHDIVMHVHDEGLLEALKGKYSIEEIIEIVEILPNWAEGFPLKAEGWRGIRYQK